MTTSTRLKLAGMANVAKDPGQVTKTVAFGRVFVLSYLCLLCLDIHGNIEKSSEVVGHVRKIRQKARQEQLSHVKDRFAECL